MSVLKSRLLFALFAPLPVSGPGAGDAELRDAAAVGLRADERGAVPRQALRHHPHNEDCSSGSFGQPGAARQAGHRGGGEEGLQPRAAPAGGRQGHQDRGHTPPPGQSEKPGLHIYFRCLSIFGKDFESNVSGP